MRVPEVKQQNRKMLILFLAGLILTLILMSLPLYSFDIGVYTKKSANTFVGDEKYLAEDGKPDVAKMELITFDPVHHTYILLGTTVGNAFSDGKHLK